MSSQAYVPINLSFRMFLFNLFFFIFFFGVQSFNLVKSVKQRFGGSNSTDSVEEIKEYNIQSTFQNVNSILYNSFNFGVFTYPHLHDYEPSLSPNLREPVLVIRVRNKKVLDFKAVSRNNVFNVVPFFQGGQLIFLPSVTASKRSIISKVFKPSLRAYVDKNQNLYFKHMLFVYSNFLLLSKHTLIVFFKKSFCKTCDSTVLKLVPFVDETQNVIDVNSKPSKRHLSRGNWERFVKSQNK